MAEKSTISQSCHILRESVQHLGVEGYNLPVYLRVSLYTRFTFSGIGDILLFRNQVYFIYEMFRNGGASTVSEQIVYKRSMFSEQLYLHKLPQICVQMQYNYSKNISFLYTLHSKTKPDWASWSLEYLKNARSWSSISFRKPTSFYILFLPKAMLTPRFGRFHI